MQEKEQEQHLEKLKKELERDERVIENPFFYDLKKSSLIEASAGCGKTYTLSILYLRLILGIGVKNPLKVAEILVITFTKNATAELKTRIREVLKNILDIFKNKENLNQIKTPEVQKTDWRLDFVNYIEGHKSKLDLLLRLEIAFNSMQEASIYTIDAWCNKVLNREADLANFDSKRQIFLNPQRFDRISSEDFWRKFVPDFNSELVDVFIQEKIIQPENLKNDIEKFKKYFLAKNLENKTQPSASEDFDYENFLQICEDLEKQEKYFADNKAQFSDTQLSIELKKKNITYTKLKLEILNWLQERKELIKARQKIYEISDLTKILAKTLKDKNLGIQLSETLATKYPFAFVDEFQDTNLEQFQILNSIYKICSKNQKNEKNEKNQNSQASSATLVLIGDPKQSIYRFRNADLNSYLKARDCINNKWSLTTNYRSDKNLIENINSFFDAFNKKTDNGIFAKAQNSSNKKFSKIDFNKVKPSNKKLLLCIDGEPQAPLKILLAPKNTENVENNEMGKIIYTSKEKFIISVANNLAQKIAHILNSKSQIVNLETGEKSPVDLSNISILVNDRIEAKKIKEELEKFNIEGVYANRESHLTSTFIFRDLQTIIRAVNSLSANDIKQALATRLMNLSVNELLALNEDASFWDEQSLRFSKYKDTWNKKSFGVFLDNLIADYDILAKLRYLSSDRDLTDFLHLTELLQAKDLEHLQPESLLDYLEIGLEEQELNEKQRFLSGEKRLQISTIHLSKGMEYDLVFVPFALHQVRDDLDKNVQSLQDLQNLENLEKSKNLENLEKSEALQNSVENYLEEARKLYVAITRAKVCLWLGLDSFKSTRNNLFKNSVFNFWLEQENPKIEYGDFLEIIKGSEFNQFLKMAKNFTVKAVEFEDKRQNLQIKKVQSYQPKKIENWHIESYTSIKGYLDLSQALQTEISVNATLNEDQSSIDLPDFADLPNLEQKNPQAPVGFSANSDYENIEDLLQYLDKGKDTGLFIHKILELAGNWQSNSASGFKAFVNEDYAENRSLFLHKKLESYLIDNKNFSLATDEKTADLNNLEELEKDIIEILSYDLFENLLFCEKAQMPQLILKDLEFCDYATELEFIFNLPKLDLQNLDEFACKNFFAGELRSKLKKEKLQGAIKGVIDLLVEKDGRFYALDYKTNKLIDDENISLLSENMQKSFLRNRYDLQAIIYIYALHKILKFKLKNYDPSKNLGGVGFLFLRHKKSFFKKIDLNFLHNLELIFEGRN